MTAERPLPVQETPDQFFTRTYGPFSDADFSGADVYKRLNLLPDKTLVIDGVKVKADTRSSVDSTALLALASVADGVAPPTGALSAANRVCADQNVGDVSGLTNNTSVDLSIDPKVHNNVIGVGASLFAYCPVAATALAGLYIQVRFRSRRA